MGRSSSRTSDRPDTDISDDAVIAMRKKSGASPGTEEEPPHGTAITVERTNSWLSNFGELSRNTDRSPIHRLAPFALAVICLLTAKLIDWEDRWSPASTPIR